MVKWSLQNAPGLLVAVFVGLTILGSVAGALWAGILTQFSTIGALGNFTFSTLVSNASTSLAVILLSVVLLSAVLGALGYSLYKGSRR